MTQQGEPNGVCDSRPSQARGSNSARAVLPTMTSPNIGTFALNATVTATTRDRSVGSTGHQQLTIRAPLRDAYSAARSSGASAPAGG